MRYDKPLLAAAIGAASTIPYEIITRIFLFMGIGKYSLYELNSFVVTINRPSEIIGLIVGPVVGGVVAIILYYATIKLGKDYMVLKGIATSLVAWTILELVFTGTIEGKFIPIRPLDDYYIHAFGSVVFGISLGMLFRIILFKKPVIT